MRDKDKLSVFYEGKDVLVPGGAGFIGSNLAKELVSLGARVTVVDSFDVLCGSNPFNIKEIEQRITLAKEKIEDFILEANLADYDIIFNCIGLTNHHIGFLNPEDDYNINCGSGIALLQKMVDNKSKCRMISTGSRSQYGKPKDKFIDETHVMNPLDVQARHKLEFERKNNDFVARFGLDLIYVRLTNTYGPGQRLRGSGIGVIGEIIRKSLDEKEIEVYGSFERIKDILFVDDVTEALLLLGMADKTDHIAFNLGGNPCKLSELVNAMEKKIKIKTKILPFPDKIKDIDTGDVILTTDRLKRVTGWTPETSIEQGIEITIGFYQKNMKEYT